MPKTKTTKTKKDPNYGYEFETINNVQCKFVRFIQPHFLLSWEIVKEGYANEQICRGVKVNEVTMDTLKEMDVWSKLSKKTQKTVLNQENEKQAKMRARVEAMQKGRKLKYPNIPKELVCTKCKEAVEINRYNLAKKLEKKDLTIEEYKKTYECPTCSPSKRGRPKGSKNKKGKK